MLMVKRRPMRMGCWTSKVSFRKTGHGPRADRGLCAALAPSLELQHASQLTTSLEPQHKHTPFPAFRDYVFIVGSKDGASTGTDDP
jgi:hypothetical protein